MVSWDMPFNRTCDMAVKTHIELAIYPISNLQLGSRGRLGGSGRSFLECLYFVESGPFESKILLFCQNNHFSTNNSCSFDWKPSPFVIILTFRADFVNLGYTDQAKCLKRLNFHKNPLVPTLHMPFYTPHTPHPLVWCVVYMGVLLLLLSLLPFYGDGARLYLFVWWGVRAVTTTAS